MKLRERKVTLPELILVAGTRAALGLGVGLLLKDKLNKDQRRGAGLALVILGGLSTIPLALEIFGEKDQQGEAGHHGKEIEAEMKCNELMTKDPACCLPTDTVFDAAQLMKSEGVGPIPIVSDKQTKKLAGIITDRDLALKVVAEGLDPKQTKIEEVMTTGVQTCGPDDDVSNVLELMEEHHVRRIPIVDDKDCLVGIIAQADVATRIDQADKTHEVVEEISRAA